jgi:NAD-dependent DNA ligase
MAYYVYFNHILSFYLKLLYTFNIKMEHVFKKHMSHYKFIDYFKNSPAKVDASYQKPSNRNSTIKHKSDKLYTQVSSSSRGTNKVSASRHQSPAKQKQEKLLKTSVLNYLHKCRSEYEENSTSLTQPKSSKNLKSINIVD